MKKKEGNWLKLYRQMLDWEWYGDTNVTRLFLHCLLKANYEDRSWRGILIQRGSFIASMQTISDEIGLSPQEISTAFKKLERTGEIVRKATNQYTSITMCNYDSYQGCDKTEQQTNNKPSINEQQTSNNNIRNKEIKKINKERNNVVEEVKEESATAPTTATKIQNNKSSINDYPSETDYLLAQEDWKQCVKQKFHAGNIEQVDIYIKAFQVYNVTMGMERHTDESDLKRHFNSWLRKELQRVGR